ncbi:hypothetical protein FHR70_002055 [Microvirga lupini]|uniref:Uncharacterized protein n=1 Tax=Microvirga lupini TaxID=420324 RepID=A0A7W4VKW8_9HYPH|nr:hypothetical protein [Microvirga lupini]MBB3019001.1 hypothetical protein [Microvirga lupini]
MASMKALALVAMSCLFAMPAIAHDWYPAWCCDEHDCRELIESRGETVTETAEGWRLWDGRLVGREHSRMSPDAKFHLCEEPTTRAIICFFAPQGAS